MKDKNTALLLSQAKGDTIGFCLEKICLNPKGFDERLYNSEPKIGSQIRLEYEQGLYSLNLISGGWFPNLDVFLWFL